MPTSNSVAVLRNNLVLDNQASGGSWTSGMGGGLYFVNSRPVLEANQIRGNQAGGALTAAAAWSW